MEHRARLAAIADHIAREVRQIALKADTANIDSWWGRASGGIVKLLAAAFKVVLELTHRYLLEHAEIEGREVDPQLAKWVTEQVLTSLRVSGPVAFKQAIRAGSNEGTAKSVMAGRLAGAAERLVLKADRETVQATVEANGEIVGWRRVGDGDPCAFCAMLISRGAVYKSGRTAGDIRFGGTEYHDNDRCTAEPLYEHEDEPGDVELLQDKWREVTAGKSGEDALRAWREWWDGGGRANLDLPTAASDRPATPREPFVITPRDPSVIFTGETDSRFLGLDVEEADPDNGSPVPDEVDLIGDLIPKTGTEAHNRVKDIEFAVSSRIDGEYAGLRVRVDHVNVAAGQLSFRATITDANGDYIGSTTRSFRRTKGKVWAYHAYLKVSKDVQGQGFAEAWNAHLMDWYIESGLDRIEVTANIDVGGYTWARQGFDFRSKTAAQAIRARLKRRLASNAQSYDADQIAAAEEILARMGLPFGDDRFPTAYEVSQIGRKPGQGKDDRWPGKDAMLGSRWSGVKPVPQQKTAAVKPSAVHGEAILDVPQARMITTEHSSIPADQLARIPEASRILYVRESVHMEWRDGMPPGWTMARSRGYARTLADYTNEEGAASPYAIRQGSAASRRAANRIAEVMATSPTNADMLAWRGLDRPQLLFGETLNGSLVGAKVHDPSFMSVSGSQEVAERYARSGRFLMRMHIPAGTRAITVNNPDDLEVLLDRGYTLTVAADTGPGTSPRIIEVTVS